MPFLRFSRQVKTSSWFETRPGRLLLGAEQAMIYTSLHQGMVQPWVWFSVLSPPAGVVLPKGRGLYLIRRGQQFAGDVRCGLHLPIASESIQSIVIQHCAACHPADLLGECERILKPGGRLWLFALNPFSPYRLRWRAFGYGASPSYRWQAVLVQVGLSCLTLPQYIGPTWLPRGSRQYGPGRPWQAAMLLIAQKRTVGTFPLISQELAWHKPVTAV